MTTHQTKSDLNKLEKLLENLYKKYNRHELIPPDPLQFVYHYKNPRDREIAGFISSAMAYGRVRQIEKSLTRLFHIMQPSPYRFVKDFNRSKAKKLADFKHRFTSGSDLADLFHIFREVLRKNSSLEKFFLTAYSECDKNILPALTNFVDRLIKIHSEMNNGQTSRTLTYLLANPRAKSPCKRLNLFLRWMIRDDDVDPGLWKSVSPEKLIIPVDVHISRLCRILGMHDKKTTSINTAIDITNTLAKIAPPDPVKYDFALSRIGITENCTGRLNARCKTCQLLKYCLGQPDSQIHSLDQILNTKIQDNTK